MASMKSIRDFLGLKRLAMVGVSRNPKDFSRTLFRELRKRGYDVTPVSPNVKEVDGVASVASVRDISPPVEGALLMTNASVAGEVVRECADAGVGQVWMYRAVGKGAVSEDAVEFCQSHGIGTVPGECPFMFLPHAGFPHNVHGFCRKAFGKYPR
jgi:predicted CoA-binding protein